MAQQTITVTFDKAGDLITLAADGMTPETDRHVYVGDELRWSSPNGVPKALFGWRSPFGDGQDLEATPSFEPL